MFCSCCWSFHDCQMPSCTLMLFLIFTVQALCITSKTLHRQKSHIDSYLIYILWCMFLCLPFSGICSSNTAASALLSLSFRPLEAFLPSIGLFMFGPLSCFLLEQGLYKDKSTPTLSPSVLFHSQLVFFSPLCWPTNERSSLISLFRNSAN